MKVKVLLFFLFAFNLTTSAQYLVNVANGNYVALSNATVLNYQASQGGYYYNTNFEFPVFARNASFATHASPPSLGGFLSVKGYLAVYETPGYDNTIVFQGLYNNDFSTVPGTTVVSAKVDGTAGSRILKFEWKDAVKGGDIAQKISFQIWLYEEDGKVEYHYGPNTFPSRASFSYCGMVVIDQGFTKVLEQFQLEGSPASPAIYKGDTTFSWPALDSIPEEGSIITFTRIGTGIKEIVQTSAGFYPNPATDQITLLTSEKIENVVISDLSGRQIRFEICSDQTISTAGLKEGVYILSFSSGNVQHRSKLIICGR